MKKFLFGFIGAIVMFTIITIFPSAIPDFKSKSAKEVKKVPIDDYILGLKEAGFTNLPQVTEVDAVAMRKYYKEKYDLDYISRAELERLILDNGIIIGIAERYIGKIPNDIAIQIAENYKKFKKTDLYSENCYIAPDGKKYTKEQLQLMTWQDQRYIESGTKGFMVMVAAPAIQFNTAGMQIIDGRLAPVPSKDPIAVIEIENGYIELGRWLTE